MTIPLLFALPTDLQMEDLLIESETLTLLLVSSRSTQTCPDCASVSSRVPRCYRQWLADLPCQGCAVRLCLKGRRFFCENLACTRHTFAELTPAHARRTRRQGNDRFCARWQSGDMPGTLAGTTYELLDLALPPASAIGAKLVTGLTVPIHDGYDILE